jgi:histone acetyltransferase (RNA polymerase elongator complex component)
LFSGIHFNLKNDILFQNETTLYRRKMEFEIEAIEDIHAKYEMLRQNPPAFKRDVTDADIQRWGGYVREWANEGWNEADIKKALRAKPKTHPNSFFLKVGRAMVQRGELTDTEMSRIEERLRISRVRSQSGVLVITVFTSPQPSYIDPVTGERRTQSFSCQWNCYYCPNQPGQPRSYLEGEPGVLRANAHGFDCRQQMFGRMNDLYNTGHSVDKLEILVLGGTWESYPLGYREEFVRDIYYSANVFEKWLNGEPLPDEQSLEYERQRNRWAPTKIIGLTIETRPDTITPAALAELRRYGCTRIQIGIQHLDDAVLKKINRKCSRTQVESAIALLKEWGFKIDAHFMPNLPGATPDLDRWMLVDELLGTLSAPSASPQASQASLALLACEYWKVAHPEIQCDQWKVYPCETTPFTVIEKWYKSGTYMPYPETELAPILLDMKATIFPWIRLNRIVRDIPRDYIMASGNRPNLRQDLGLQLKKQGRFCRCIRCREVKRGHYQEDKAVYRARQYEASGGLEYFLSCEETEADDSKLYGFLRLRIPSGLLESPHPSFTNHAWIRELHVYGTLQKAGVAPRFAGAGATRSAGAASAATRFAGAGATRSAGAASAATRFAGAGATQHRGIGKTLMNYAEGIARSHGRSQCIVIAGEGTKNYYSKLGYEETHLGYMSKTVS